MHVLKTALLLGTGLACVSGFYDKRDAVVELTPKNFRSAVLDTNQLVAVEFFAPWCGHCQKLAPDWKKAANNLKNLVTVGAVNCDEEANKPLCGKYDVKGFPTIKVFAPERKAGSRKKPTDYQGPRDAKSMVDYFLSMQPSNVRFVKGDSSKAKSKKSIVIEDFLATKNTTLPKALLFTDKATTTPLYKALSVEFGDSRMLLGEVKKSEKAVLDMFGIQSFPTLLVISPEAGHVKYEDKLKYQALHAFLDSHALPKQNGEKAKPKDEPKAAPSRVEEIGSIALLNRQRDNINVVALVSGVEKKETIEMMDSLNQQHGALFRFGWMDESKAGSVIDKLDLVRDFPTLFIIHPGKQLYRPYIGAWDKASISKWLESIGTGKLQAWPYQGELVVSEKQWRDEL
ncbi:protein disulfide isomerase (PDI) protein [Apophysomyces sp. BC1034]|nr:protein disulfide isomerase (PDI) protein [Apophysomyces sp. BC1015]KAG0170811.1 protein disulfide isomerase (PDI) protein [Apophysomyces sp. BC1021]KAG0185099.1 protein disulfide isomerase (PDI) protein [Apophysomyces sp. BC1034]